MEYTEITPADFDTLDGVDDWRVVFHSLMAEFACGSFAAAAALSVRVADAAEGMQHHPDIDIRYPDLVRVTITTHATGGLTDLDVALAREVSVLAAGIGASLAPSVPQSLEIAIDTMDADRIRPFWAAALGYRERDGDLVDPLRIRPLIWFQQMDEPRLDRDRFHLDVSVPHDQAEQRVAEVIAAGGRLVTDEFAKSWWVLADADGNEACICTWQDR
jgi:4a-hydroxytetrahydrobiopterin dehydratase